TDEVHECRRAHRDQLGEGRRQVLLPDHQQVEELVQSSGDRPDAEDDAQSPPHGTNERIVFRVWSRELSHEGTSKENRSGALLAAFLRNPCALAARLVQADGDRLLARFHLVLAGALVVHFGAHHAAGLRPALRTCHGNLLSLARGWPRAGATTIPNRGSANTRGRVATRRAAGQAP